MDKRDASTYRGPGAVWCRHIAGTIELSELTVSRTPIAGSELVWKRFLQLIHEYAANLTKSEQENHRRMPQYSSKRHA